MKDANLRFLKFKSNDPNSKDEHKEYLSVTTDSMIKWLTSMEYTALDMANVPGDDRPSDQFIMGAYKMISLVKQKFQETSDKMLVDMTLYDTFNPPSDNKNNDTPPEK